MKHTVICKVKKVIKVLVKRPPFPNDPSTRNEPNIGDQIIELSDLF